MSALPLADISVGEHITRTWFGLTIDVDTVISTIVAGAIIIALGLYLRARATAGVPGRLQLAFETIVSGVQGQIESSMGDQGQGVVPLALTLFVFILVANWLEMIPTGHSPQYLPAPSADVNFTLALGFAVIVAVHFTWIRRKGFRAYAAHYFRPYAALFPINVIEELVKPITLAFRLFGNIFAGSLLLILIVNLLPQRLVAPTVLLDVLWKLFAGLFVAPLQAFIFSLLTILYFETAIAQDGH